MIGKRKKHITLVFENHDFRKKIFYFFKNMTFWKMHLFIKLDQQSTKILQDHTFLYIPLTNGVSNVLVPLFFKSRFLWKIMLFPKKHDFLWNYICLLNQLNKVCTFIYNQTFKYILDTILNMKRLVPLILKITTSKNITLFLKKHDLKNRISLINQINKVCTFSFAHRW